MQELKAGWLTKYCSLLVITDNQASIKFDFPTQSQRYNNLYFDRDP